ncbi:hypothetical protein ACF1AE_33840 [Streptomyces sp. NPDC014986]|uniref:hypothetical protein n=1 Tax=Streptomyces sp. NPDC014986 TaxID=3364934 RepID=UPI0036F6176C
MPDASAAERRAKAARQLHQDLTARAWAKAHEWEQDRARQTAAAQARVETEATQSASHGPTTPAPSVVLPIPRPVTAPKPADLDVDKNHQVVSDHIDQNGETSARRPFSNQLIDDRRSAWRVAATWSSPTPRGSRRERRRGVQGRPDPDRAAGRDEADPQEMMSTIKFFPRLGGLSVM